jgi:hypothetical protein
MDTTLVRLQDGFFVGRAETIWLLLRDCKITLIPLFPFAGAEKFRNRHLAPQAELISGHVTARASIGRLFPDMKTALPDT